MHVSETIERWETEVSRLDARNPKEWDDLDLALDESQYGYIRLGLLIEKIRNKNYWKYATGRFDSFKVWCERRLGFTVWQANSYVSAARIAIYLAGAGYQKLPINYSQAIALLPAYQGEIGYYQDRPALERIWEAACKLGKITAAAIERLVNPDKPEKESTRLPKHLLERAKKAAARKGMSLDEYLEDLIGADEHQETIDNENEIVTAPDPELGRIVADLERRNFAPVRSMVEIGDEVLDRFDRIMSGLLSPRYS